MAASRFNFALLFLILFFATVLRISADAPCTLGEKPSLEFRTKILQGFPRCQTDIQLDDQYSLTGFTLTDSSSLNRIIRKKTEFFASREDLCAGRKQRFAYIKYNADKLKKLQDKIQEIIEANPNDEDKKKAEIEEFARYSVNQRNTNRMSRYDSESARRRLRERNLQKYNNEEGPTPEYLFDKYGSWEEVILASARPQRCLSFAFGILPSEEEISSILSKQEL